MKKHLLILMIALLILTGAVLGGITLSKYISTLWDESSTFVVGEFYFRSNLLTDDEEAPVHEVLGIKAEFVLANGQDTTHYTDEDVCYRILYFVRDENNEWVEMADAAMEGTLTAAEPRAFVSVSSIHRDRLQDGEVEVYDEVLVKAQAILPAQPEQGTEETVLKTLSAVFEFYYTPMALSYDYDRDLGVITLTVSTNDDVGEYLIAWTPGLLPDNADPSGVLTHAYADAVENVCNECAWVYDASVGDPAQGVAPGTAFADLPDEFVCPHCGVAEKDEFLNVGLHRAMLEANTSYRLMFIVPAEARPQIDQMIKNVSDEDLIAMLEENVICIPVAYIP